MLCSAQELLPDAETELRTYLSYPLEETLASEKAAEVVADDIREVADAVLAAYDSGALLAGVKDSPDGFKVRSSLPNSDSATWKALYVGSGAEPSEYTTAQRISCDIC